MPKKNEKFTKFFFFSQDHANLGAFVQEKKKLYESRKLQDQLYLVICKALEASFDTSVCYHVVLNETVWDFPNIEAAVDFSLKLFLTQKLQYPVGCQHVWSFIQIYVYKLEEVKAPVAGAALQDLWNLLEKVKVVN